MKQENNTLRNITKRAAMMLLLTVMTATAWAQESDGEWYYSLTNDGNCNITGSALPDNIKMRIRNLSIPKTIGDKTVVSISQNALSGFTNLTTIMFYQDASIQNMPYVQNNTNFKNVDLINDGETTVAEKTLPTSMTDIGNAFRGSGITGLTMPSVTSIGGSAFEGCNSLTSVTFGKEVTIQSGGYQSTVFSKIGSSCTVSYPGEMSKWSCYDYQFSPNLVINCGDGSCGWCGDGWSNGTNYQNSSCLYWTLLKVTGHLTIDCVQQDYMDYSKQTIKTQKWDKTKVKELTLGRLVLNQSEFSGCSSLTTVNISANVTNIVPSPFYDCPSLTRIVVDSNNPIYDSRDDCNAIIQTVSKTLVVGCKNTSFPSSVTNIGDHAFAGCTDLTSFTIPNNVTTIGVAAFEGCNGLISITIPNSVTTIGEYAFRFCTGLVSITIPNRVTTIENYIFMECHGLTTVTIPSSVTAIGAATFQNCYSLTDIYYDGTLEQWGQVTKGDDWNENVSANFTEHWRCTVTFDANGHGSAPAAQTNLWSNKDKVTEPAALSADGYLHTGWYSDAACTTKWDFATDVVTGDKTLYAGWGTPCSATFTTTEAEVEIPYGQEWTDIPVTVSSLNLGWFQNEGQPVRPADAVTVVPYVGTATSYISLVSSDGMIDAYKGAGAHTVGNRVSEQLTAVGQSGKLWVYIPQAAWDAAAGGDYFQTLPYSAAFLYNGVTPSETYIYDLSNAMVTIRTTVPEAVTLTFDANGGTGDAMAAVNGRVGYAMTLPACTYFAPSGKQFLCWNTKADGTGTRYYVGPNYTFTEVLTLYAEWGEGYTIDLTTATEQNITLGLSGQLIALQGYFMNDNTMGLDVNLDGTMDVELTQDYDDVNGVTVCTAKRLTTLTDNYRFVLTYGGEPGEYGSVTFKFVNEDATVEQPAITQLYDNDTDFPNDLLSLKDGITRNIMIKGRTLYTDGAWNTLCLPFDVNNFTGTPLDGFTVKELDTETAYGGHTTGIEGTTLYLNFKDATRIEAGKPYIVKKMKNTIPSCTATNGTPGSSVFVGYDLGYANLVDGDKYNTYWRPTLDKSVASVICDFHTTIPVQVTSYELTTCIAPQTNPTAWTLKAKVNETDDWMPIDSRDVTMNSGDALPQSTITSKIYPIKNPGTYQYYRFEVTGGSASGNTIGLAELTLQESINITNPVFPGVIVNPATGQIPNPERYTYLDPEYITAAVPANVNFTGGKFCGNYKTCQFDGKDQSILFLGAANTLYWPENGVRIGPFRSYFQIDTPSAVRAMVLGFDDDEEATGIISVEDNSQPSALNSQLNNYWYSLDGVRFDSKPTKKGLYIHNGRKVAIK
ncbi:MAG: leucine-rich repeat protein [Bacteroidaceae bacterium]|nr:leucine-rich repeat protein [Bacteroidaceae bacterium]